MTHGYKIGEYGKNPVAELHMQAKKLIGVLGRSVIL